MSNQQHFNNAAAAAEAAITAGQSKQDRLNQQLFDAAGKGETGQVKTLLAMGADVHYQDHQQFTPLHMAAAKNHVETIIALVEAGAPLDQTGKSNWTPLHRAVQWRAAEAAATLISLGADTSPKDNFGMTAQDVAEHFQYVEVAHAIRTAEIERLEKISLGNSRRTKKLHAKHHAPRAA